MIRRPGLIAALLCFAVLVAATAPWTYAPGVWGLALGRQIHAAFDLDLDVKGRGVIAFLPAPRVKLENVVLTRAGRPVVTGGTLRARFKILPLLVGRLELDEIALSGSRIDVALGQGGFDLAVSELRERFGGGESHAVRLSLSETTLVIRDVRTGVEGKLASLTATGIWPAGDDAIALDGSAVFNNEPVRFAASGLKPRALLAGRASPIAIEASAPAGTLRIDGQAIVANRLAMTGRVHFETRSLKDFQTFSGWHFPLGTMVQAVTFDSDFKADPDAVEWPRVRLALGADRLDGALSARRNGGRLAITGTLAADRITLPGLAGIVRPARTGGGTVWNPEPIRLGDLTAADLDLRLSIGQARFGDLALDDVAANLFVTKDRVEASLGRAGVDGGTIKGRASATIAASGLDTKLQGSFEQVGLASLLGAVGVPRWITAAATGQVTLASTGTSALEIARGLNGRVSAAAKSGDLVGISLPDIFRRFERRPLAVSADWRGGRTAFDNAQIVLDITNGVGEIAQAQAVSGTMRGTAHGRIALIDRTMKLRVLFENPETAGPVPVPPIGFDLAGPWHDISVAPDVEMLIRRSGAVRSLLGLDRRATEAAPAGTSYAQ